MMIFEFKPETDEDIKKRREEKERNRIFKSVSYQEAISRIAELIFKNIYYGNMINRDSPKILGGVQFWIEHTDEGNSILRYNRHPRNWDKDAVILDIETEEFHWLNNLSGMSHKP